MVINAHQPRPTRLPFLAVLVGLFLGVPQTVISQSYLVTGQESGESDRERLGKPASKQSIAEATERLRRSVNGKAIVHNCHQSKGHDVRVEESSEITQITGCDLILKTRKTTTLPDGPRELEFTLYAHLADLTTPASVEPQSFSECKPATGAILKVMSRAQPGKGCAPHADQWPSPRMERARLSNRKLKLPRAISAFSFPTLIWPERLPGH